MKTANRIIRGTIFLAAVLGLAGCATVINGTTQTVRVEARTQAGESVPAAECVAFNDRGSTHLKPGAPQLIRRSAADIHFVCTHPGLSPALGTATSRANPAIAGNLIVGGLIGVAIDLGQGAAYTYPAWIQMQFGKALLFDTHLESSGQPMQGYAAGSAPPALAPSANPTSLGCMHQAAGLRC